MIEQAATAEQQQQPRGRIPLRSTAPFRKLLRDYFVDLNRAAEDPTRKVAWLSSVGPVELVRGMGFEVYFPENHGALLGATRTAARYIPHAVSEGYSPDICSYLTSDIGADLAGKSPLQKAYGIPGPPRPDVLVYSTNQCRDVGDWWDYYGRKFRVPVVSVHPPSMLDHVGSEHVRVVQAEHNRVRKDLEAITGRKLDPDLLRETVALSRESALLWREVLNFCRHQPSPFTFFDGVIHMAPIVLMRGTRAATDYYRLLIAELAERVRDNVAAVPGENLRLYWEGMPVWGALRELSTLFFQMKAAVVASTYCNTWAFDQLDPDAIGQSMARAYTEIFVNRSEPAKLRILQRLIHDFGVDGIIFHDCKTCPSNTNCHYGMPERIHQQLGVPSVVFGGDMTDSRMFSADQTRTTLESFIEQLNSF
ncbi:MAG: 2-hydroxyacyl-CoA dehydratase subunit D [Acidobacteriota bacterium]